MLFRRGRRIIELRAYLGKYARPILMKLCGKGNAMKSSLLEVSVASIGFKMPSPAAGAKDIREPIGDDALHLIPGSRAVLKQRIDIRAQLVTIGRQQADEGKVSRFGGKLQPFRDIGFTGTAATRSVTPLGAQNSRVSIWHW